MAKVDKVENTDTVVEKKVEKKLSKGSKKVHILKKRKLRKIFLMELLMCNQHLIIL
jgi:hypothetical protein